MCSAKYLVCVATAFIAACTSMVAEDVSPVEAPATEWRIAIHGGAGIILRDNMTPEAEAVSKTPLLSDIPLVGELFKNRSDSTSRSRFYVFIRASVLRHEGFADLKYLSDTDVVGAEIDNGWPDVEPRIIR